MKKCKWAGDVNDEYCKGCDGVTMEVDGKSISCEDCAGYEESEDSTVEKTEEPIPESIPDKIEDDMQSSNITNDVEKTTQTSTKTQKTNNNTPNKEKDKNEIKNKASNKPVIVATESKEEEVRNDIRVTSLRYTSGATVKKGDNYFKFVAEEEWDVSQVDNIDDVREQLWAKLNGEVDKQIEELQNMN